MSEYNLCKICYSTLASTELNNPKNLAYSKNKPSKHRICNDCKKIIEEMNK